VPVGTETICPPHENWRMPVIVVKLILTGKMN
jgi:hypothetical protein